MSEQVTEQVEGKEEKPDGKEKLDFNELPEEVRDKFEARFNRVYGHMKEYERISRTLEKDQKALLERLETVESTQVQDRAEQRIESIRTQTAAALEAGDIDRVKELQDQLAGFIKDHSQPPPKQKEEPKPDEGYIPPEAASALTEWANEIDDSGNFRRPWAQPQHGKYNEAIEIAEGVYRRMRGEPLPKILETIDEKVRAELYPKKPGRTQAVLGADNGVTPAKDSPVKLTADQITVAHRLYGDKKIKDKDSGQMRRMTTKEMEDRYAKALKG